MCRIHTLLARDHGLTASEDTLVRFAHQELGGRKPRLTVLVRDGDREQEAQIDFGLVGTLADNTGRVRRLYALVMSRYLVVWPTYLQTTEAVYKGLDAAWAFFAATVHVLVPDHMVAIAAKADPLTPTIAPAFLDDGQARNLYVDRARVRAPRDKGRVEHQIPYVRES
jgi:transposase